MAHIRRRDLESGAVRFQVQYVDRAGTKRAKQFKKRRDAETWLHQTMVEVEQGIHVAESGSISVEAACRRWLVHIEKEARRGALEPTTEVYYRSHCAHIRDPKVGLGTTKLNRLTKAEVNSLRDRLLANGRSEELTRRSLSSLAMVIDHAIDDGLAAINPVRGVKVRRTKRTKDRVHTPSAEDVRAIINQADDPMRQILIIAAFCGLRASEIYGLTWENVDLENKCLQVRQRVDCYGRTGEPKSAAGVRDVPFGPFVLNTLREWRLKMGGKGLVFTNQRGLPLLHSNVSYRWFKHLFFEKTMTDKSSGSWITSDSMT